MALVLLTALAVAAVAEARAPVIAHVDPASEKLALYDAETGSVLSAPDIAIPGPVRRYAVSHDGRYVLYADEDKKLHLFDRAGGAEVPLPGVDEYATPGGLTVSSTGLIAFDDNGNGPALVYDSGTGSFLDVGLPPENAHRQSRLSGDGRFLATTCNNKEFCAEDRGEDSSLYLQDISQQVDVPVPDDLSGADDKDEEHPCVDGDGSLVGADIPADAAAKRDVFLYDLGAMASVFPEDLNAPEEADVNCTLDSSGTYVGWQTEDEGGDVTFKLLDRTSGQLVGLPTDGRFAISPIWLTDPYPPPSTATATAGVSDRDPPRFLGRVTVSNRSFRAASASARRAPVGTRFRYRLSEAATVTIAIQRRRIGRRVGRRCVRPRRRDDRPRCARWRTRGSLTASARAGRNSTAFSGRLANPPTRVGPRPLRPGRYRARLVARDAAGNSSAPRLVRFRVVRR